jgi:hypothetical protein
MSNKKYYLKGRECARSSNYGNYEENGIGGKIRAYEENFGKVVGSSKEWIKFLKGWDEAYEGIL